MYVLRVGMGDLILYVCMYVCMYVWMGGWMVGLIRWTWVLLMVLIGRVAS